VVSARYSPEIVREIVARCEADPQREVCGFVVRIGGALAVREIENVADRYHALDPLHFPRSSRDSYLMDAKAQLQVHREVAERGGEIVAVWHSHVEVGAYFSAKDRKDAVVEGIQQVPGAQYLVFGVRAGAVTEAKLYEWINGDFLEEPVELRRAAIAR
jgi:proteasome lid subunit RPN8/RPN11